MRGRLFLAAVLTTAAVAISPTRFADAAAPPPCLGPNNGLGQCAVYPGAGHRGSIGLLGDSVLLGSADGASNPGLPRQLSGAGWGPIAFVATLGMRTYWDLNQYPGEKYRNTSAVYWVQHWHAAGFYPTVVAVNLGNNHLGECTRATYLTCKQRIDQLLDVIGPTATVWWPKINFSATLGNSAIPTYRLNYESSLAWNLALDKAAAQRKNLVVWDWPRALATSNPRIVVDNDGIHPVSSVEYVKRSRLMLEQIDTYMPAHFAGPAAALPKFAPAGLHFVPFEATTAKSAVLLPSTSLVAGRTLDLALRNRPSVAAGAAAVALTVVASNAAGPGALSVFRCGDAVPPTINLSFARHGTRVGQAIGRLSSAGHICVRASASITLSVAIEGSFVKAPAGDALATTGNARSVIGPSNSKPSVLHTPVGDAVTADITVNATGGNGRVTLYDCDHPVPTTPTAVYIGAETVTAAAIVHTSAAHTICVAVTPASGPRPTVVIDQHHVFRKGPGLTYTPVTPLRLLDTRTARGGWYGRHVARQVLSLPAGPAAARLLVGAVTMAGPLARGTERLGACGSVSPPNAAVAANAGATATNTLLAAVAAKVCLTADQNTHSAVDLFGWWS
jgi:hypothetical protein